METTISEKVTNNKPEELRKLFNSMLKGSNAAKYLSIIYAIASFTLVFKYRNDLMYCIPLIIGGLLTIGYAYKYLWLRGIKTSTNKVDELISNVKLYKEETLKREKYEHFVMTFWMLTIVPWYIDGMEITTELVIGLLVVFYLFSVFGSWAFARVKMQLEEMDNLVKELKTVVS